MSDEELIDALARAIATSMFFGVLPSPANVVDYRTEAVAALAVIAPELKALRAENARLLEALKNWDALIRHQYTGSREAMSDMTECAQETAKLLFGDDPWPKIEARAAMGETE